ncbi:extracellular solute-binding protein [Paenibacillus pectinilyticus]|nr:extracellular solute-binding protein [Paenibacillus pectinilyticus]
MSQKKTISMLALTAAMLVFSGCTAKEAAPSVSPSEKSSPSEASTAPKEKLKLDLMTISWAGGGWPDDHAVIQKLNEKLNIDLKIQWVPNDNYKEKLNVMAASNSFPDAYFINPPEFQKWRDAGIFMDVKPELSKYSNLTKYLGEDGFNILNPKGKAYGLPYYSVEARDPMMIRKDWLDKLGLKMPTTVDEYYEVAKAFATKDPDGNGQNDTVGISFVMQTDGSILNLEHLMGAFGLANNWKEIDGKLVPYQVQGKELKDFLTFLQKAYSEGVLDKDFMTNKARDPWSKLEAGKTGISWVNPFEFYTTSMDTIKKVDPKAELVQLPAPKGPTGLQGTKTSSSVDKIVINSKIDKKKQERLLALFDYMMSDEGTDLIKNGVEGVHYKKNGDKYEKLDAFDKDRPQLISTWLLRRYDPMIQIRKWDDAAYVDKINTIFKENEKAKWTNPASGLISDTQVKVGNTINSKFGEEMAKIIMGKSPVSAIDKAIEAWKAGGGDAIIKEMNEQYAKLK